MRMLVEHHHHHHHMCFQPGSLRIGRKSTLQSNTTTLQVTSAPYLHILAHHLQRLTIQDRAKVQIDERTQLQPATQHSTA
jgi:hypothetical protein